MATHTAADVLAAAPGLTYRQLDHWSRKGYLHTESNGTGHNRRYSDSEHRVAAVMHRLTAAGIRPDVAARIARGDTHLAPGITILITPTSDVPDGAHWCTLRGGQLVDDADQTAVAA